jgi:site-specific recombinase XerD
LAARSPDREDLQEFIDALRARGRSPKTCATYRESVLAFATFTARKGMPLLADVRREHVEDFLRGMHARGHKPATVRNRYAGLRQFFNWMVDADIRSDHPMVRIHAPTVPQQVQPDYTPEEVTRLLGAIGGRTVMDLRDRAIISVFYDCGLRCEELCNIGVRDVDREARRIVIRSGKGGRGRIVGYSHETANALNRYLRKRGGWDVNLSGHLFTRHDHGALTRNAVRMMMQRRFAAAGVEYHGTHGFRRSWAMADLDAGGDPMDLKELAGWSSFGRQNQNSQSILSPVKNE